MKKILILMLCASIYIITAEAQTAVLQIDNSATPCTLGITMHAECIGELLGGCNGAVSDFVVNAYSSESWSNPNAFESAIGWSNSVSVIPPPPPFGAYYSDFQWTYATVVLTCPCGVDFSNIDIGNTSTMCASTSSYGPSTGCGGYTISWSSGSGSTLANVTITVY